jgi:excisionase family DNA binding protein
VSAHLKVIEPRKVYLTKEEVARKLRVTVRTVDKYRAKEGLPSMKRGNRVWFDEDAVDAWAAGGAS